MRVQETDPPNTFMPTPDQIEEVRTICRISSYSEIETRVNALSEAGWLATESDLAEYAKIKNKYYRTSADIPVEYAQKRLEISNRIRVRLGYPEINESGDLLSASARMEDFSSSSNVDTEVVW